MSLRRGQPRYGCYGLKVYVIALVSILILGFILCMVAYTLSVPAFYWLGISALVYSVVSTLGWYAARYIIPGSPVEVARTVVFSLRLNGTESVLDVGTGRGLYAIEIAKRLTSGAVTAIDVWEPEKTPNLVYHHRFAQPTGNTRANALRNAEKECVADRISFINMDVNRLQLRDGTFDLVICSYVLSHLGEHSVDALKEIHRVMKSPGRLLIVDNVRDWTYFLLSTPHLFALSFLRGKKARRLTENFWRSILVKGGFNLTRFSRGKGIILIEAHP